ncbi:hypothetical protein AOL_s00173g23 [Orbilia oligospora ATCC 24927]|uniref:Uncharacterized protein n=1 Tax=Arthrobotrys oligospora (strain ATCC 24927 / CBS 115.81 / DSM 1491) TaxID=756982 RepID=G1XNK5_ARTOA|nr:hypothetical protein AOL_s00173g23 [Orbilia oligospora ATCC 24927]EGX44922.1 hypothetical protein AOL_s00173g23 [Orbilia oligospora ATCC 24927]
MPEIRRNLISALGGFVWSFPLFAGIISLYFNYQQLKVQPQAQALLCKAALEKSLDRWTWCSNRENAQDADCQPILGKNYYDIERQHKCRFIPPAPMGWIFRSGNGMDIIADNSGSLVNYKPVFFRKGKASQGNLSDASEKLVPSSTSGEVLPPDTPKQTIEPGSPEEVVLPSAPGQTIESGSSEEVLLPDAAERMVQSGSSEEVFISGSSEGPEENRHRWLEIAPNQQHSRAETETETETFETASTQSSKPKQKKHTRYYKPESCFNDSPQH